MSDKVTPLPHPKGTPKSMRPLIPRVTYYLIGIVGIIHVFMGLYVYYETGVLGLVAVFSVQPATLAAVIEFFSGIFGVTAAFGLRRLEYWGVLSTAIFGVFELWNGTLLSQTIQFGLSTNLGITVSSSLQGTLAFIFQVLGVLIVILCAISLIRIRQHRRVARELKA